MSQSISSQGATLNHDGQNAQLFVLPSTITIESVEIITAEFKQMQLSEKTTLTLDASKVENITTPGLQLMVSLEKTLGAHGGALVFKDMRETFIHAFKDAGLDGLLKLSQITGGN